MSALYKETQIFEKHRQEWAKERLNEWVWIHNDSIRFFETYEAAINCAYAEGFSKEPIFVKQITPADSIPFVASHYSWAI